MFLMKQPQNRVKGNVRNTSAHTHTHSHIHSHKLFTAALKILKHCWLQRQRPHRHDRHINVQLYMKSGLLLALTVSFAAPMFSLKWQNHFCELVLETFSAECSAGRRAGFFLSTNTTRWRLVLKVGKTKNSLLFQFPYEDAAVSLKLIWF